MKTSIETFEMTLPIDVLSRNILNSTDLKIYSIIQDSVKSSNENSCTLSNPVFSERVGVNRVSISRSINKLAKLGYIKVDYLNTGGMYRKITLID